ncbi:phosphotransferase family protein [Bacillus sp. FJAT-27445]|uniref:phosphotransferase family protein n=1 Tax=Bacillus sp. FJAT-27445 TaxID=1679166 RepID=UPI00074373D5|nr:phosphotransferase family protein [Bacillus sp. FJAT-27445]
MDYLLGEDWEITPAGGATGKAFFATHHEQRLFLKRNSSPFLAVLSAEGIVPKLVWTKRLENGDVITAQQWKSGRELEPHEMAQERVAKLLKKIHRSEAMLLMLRRLGKAPVLPEKMLAKLEKGLDPGVAEMPEVQQANMFLKKEVGNIHFHEYVVCHCDVNHNNWLLGEDSRLYLIDWDGAMVGDPAIDLGMLLYWYIPEEDWEEWLNRYGTKLTEQLKRRMKWYVAAQAIESIQWHKRRGRFEEMNKWTDFLTGLL